MDEISNRKSILPWQPGVVGKSGIWPTSPIPVVLVPLAPAVLSSPLVLVLVLVLLELSTPLVLSGGVVVLGVVVKPGVAVVSPHATATLTAAASRASGLGRGTARSYRGLGDGATLRREQICDLLEV